MYSKLSILAFVGVALLATSCDEGDIYPDEVVTGPTGRTAHLEGSVVNSASWPEGYSVSFAGFDGDDEYALISKTVDPEVLERDGAITLSGIPQEVTVLELCVTDRLRRRVATFKSLDCDGKEAGLVITADNEDVGPMRAVQQEVFNTTCANCHGASNHAAAGLSLLAGESHPQLVGQPSSVEAGTMRVVGGNLEESLLWKILSSDHSSGWRYDHSVEVVNPIRLNLLKAWIESGASS